MSREIFYVQTDNPKINRAADDATRFIKALNQGDLALPDFFTHTSHTPEQVLQTFQGHIPVVAVREYTSSWFFRNVLGHYKNGVINVNTRFSNSASVSDVAGNLVHELCHHMGYQHKGNNPTPYNLKSVPYVLGYMARDFVKNGF
jgi:hypothetical protein